MAAKGKALSIALAIVAIFASSSALASIPRSTVLDPPPFELLRESTPPATDPATEHEPSLPIFTNEKLDLLGDVARIEMPRPSISETLERRTGAMLSAYDDARKHRIFDAVSAELASWPLASGDENNFNRERQLSLKLRRATEFQALPFTDPATGLIFVRARWYDPQTGTFVSPDPLGYGASGSNLYSFAGGDPVNGRDPTGEAAANTANGGVYIRNTKTGARYKVSGQQAQADPIALQDLLMIEGGLSAQEAKDFLQDMGLKYTHPYQRPVVTPKLPSKGGWREWTKAAFIATTPLPPQTREQEILSGGVQLVSSLTTAFGSPYAYRGTASTEPVVRLSNGQVSAPIPVSVADARGWTVPDSPTPELRRSVQGSYIDPLTNVKVATGQVVAADHIIPQSYIKRMPGFNRLSPQAQGEVLNFEWNIQALLNSPNASKNNKLPADWTRYKGQPLDPGYIGVNGQLQQILIPMIQAQINSRLGQ